MFLFVVFCLAIAAGLVGIASRRALRKLAQRGFYILDLVRLLVTIKVKAAQVRRADWSTVDIFEECVAQHGDSPAIIMAEPPSTTTYDQLDRMSNQVAHWARRQGVGRGDTIALVMPSCPSYVAFWLGMAKAGACTALVNIHIKGPPLVHAIRTALQQSKSQMVVVERSLAACVLCDEVRTELPAEVCVRVYSIGDEFSEHADQDVRAEIARMSQGPVPAAGRRGITWKDTLLYVYTSGTTGLPKASKITHLRFFSAAALFSVSARLRSDDRVYCALPLYHSSGGMLGVGGCWRAGCCLVVRPRFSVRHFSPDCVMHRCTVVQYIGEVARYLINSRDNHLDKQCCVRVAFGNGLSPDVWERFQKRYRIDRIVEFYASTEGNVNMVNNTGEVGAVGVVPWFAECAYPILLLRVDQDREELVRDRRGRCVRCRPGEVGQVVGLINDRDPSRCFDGYTDPIASEKKVVRHVVRHGDAYFASGDLLRRDSFGFYFWVDRMGDTFRWKGENVATTEVAQVICGFPGVADVNVYGVVVPGAEGRAGMAAIKFKSHVHANDFDWQGLFTHVVGHLPSYAQPQFLRVAPHAALTAHMTTTFKQIKTQLRREGFDPARVSGDAIFFRDVVAKTYVPFTMKLYHAIHRQSLRL